MVVHCRGVKAKNSAPRCPGSKSENKYWVQDSSAARRPLARRWAWQCGRDRRVGGGLVRWHLPSRDMAPSRARPDSSGYRDYS